MEYLMTYGWAILIVIIVAAALYALGVFNPTTWTGSRATGFANVGAPTEWTLDGGSGNFTLVIPNHVGESINITSVKVEIGGASQTNTTYTDPVLASGSTTTYIIQFGTSPIASGSSYSAQVTIKYKKASGTLELTDTGTLTGTAS